MSKWIDFSIDERKAMIQAVSRIRDNIRHQREFHRIPISKRGILINHWQ